MATLNVPSPFYTGVLDQSQTQSTSAQDLQHAEEREDSAYQRAVEDMKKAGLNPALLATGLSSGATSQASAQFLSASAEQEKAKAQKMQAISQFIKSAVTLALLLG